MHTLEGSHRSNDECLSPYTSGPLPKSDSVQSLVSFMNCSHGPRAAACDEDCTIRGVDGDANSHSVLVTPETDFVSMSGLGLKTISLSVLNSSPASRKLREVSLAANALEVIDLTPLASCPLLTVLTLNSNRLSSIELKPLASCVKLERLWLHDNRLESIDLSPLEACTSLRSLYLEDNSLHDASVDLSPLGSTTKLRSLRLGGNRLNGTLDLTPLLQCPALSVFNVDSSVSLVSDGESSQARVSSALRRIVLDVKFTGRVVGDKDVVVKRRTTPPVARAMRDVTARSKRRMKPPGGVGARSPTGKPGEKKNQASPIVKVLLIGFRRLARYAAEDSFARCGKIMIRASGPDVATREPALVFDSHLVILYAPSEKTVREILVVAGRIPTVVIGTERYRSTANNCILELLDRFNFYADPLDPEDTQVVYNMGKDYATRSCSVPSASISNVDLAASLSNPDSSPVSEEEDGENGELCSRKGLTRNSLSDSSLGRSYGVVDIDLEDIEDESGAGAKDQAALKSSSQFRLAFRPRHSVESCGKLKSADGLDKSAVTLNDVSSRLRNGRKRSPNQGWGSGTGGELSMHGKNKLRAECSAIEISFSDLGGYADIDSCAGIARACGLPKCAGPVLFRAAFGWSFEIESTTPEDGVPNPHSDRKNLRISSETFLSFWERRLKVYGGEERLSNILEDCYRCGHPSAGSDTGHSRYGAPSLRKVQARMVKGVMSSPDFNTPGQGRSLPSRSFSDHNNGRPGNRLTSAVSMDLSCPCDAGIEALITTFMEGRSSRFGSFALVKLTEAIAIGFALVIYEIRGMSKHRVGGRARAVCPKEVREGKLNSALIAAEVGIFEGVASGLSMDQIRSVKGCFATEASPAAISRSCGLALNYSLSLEEVQRFCILQKTLMPGAVKRAMVAHCKNPKEMALAEFAVFLSVLSNISSNGAVDYLFTVVDCDEDDRWMLPDLRHFHMEKEEMWRKDGMAVSDLADIWVNFIDMIRPADPSRGVTRRDLRKLASKERKIVLQSLLFVDDDHTLVNIRRTMELNKGTDSLLMM